LRGAHHRHALLRAVALASALALATVTLAHSAGAQRRGGPADGWHDTARHTPGFVRVAPGVRLHYLDFGGTGPSLLLLAGLGNTAHAFDEFAPRFTDHFHVVALTRRGFGESDHPPTGYDTPRLVDDILAAIDGLHLGRVSIVGHSIAGEEMTRLAATHPDRVDKLVYLDAAYDRVAADSMFNELFPVPPDLPEPPQPTAADTATPAAYVAFVHRTRGVNIPEADIRTRYRYDGWNEEITPAYRAIGVERPAYRSVRAPALAIYAVTDTVSQLEPWQRTDRAHAADWQDFIRLSAPVEQRLRAEFKNEVANSSVLELHGAHHWIFVSNFDEVVAATRRFLGAQ
jgi:pimeloyl-ACP methyl ester carboxylesterase